MYKTAEGKGENKYGLDGGAARSESVALGSALSSAALP